MHSARATEHALLFDFYANVKNSRGATRAPSQLAPCLFVAPNFLGVLEEHVCDPQKRARDLVGHLWQPGRATEISVPRMCPLCLPTPRQGTNNAVGRAPG